MEAPDDEFFKSVIYLKDVGEVKKTLIKDVRSFWMIDISLKIQILFCFLYLFD